MGAGISSSMIITKKTWVGSKTTEYGLAPRC